MISSSFLGTLPERRPILMHMVCALKSVPNVWSSPRFGLPDGSSRSLSKKGVKNAALMGFAVEKTADGTAVLVHKLDAPAAQWNLVVGIWKSPVMHPVIDGVAYGLDRDYPCSSSRPDLPPARLSKNGALFGIEMEFSTRCAQARETPIVLAAQMQGIACAKHDASTVRELCTRPADLGWHRKRTSFVPGRVLRGRADDQVGMHIHVDRASFKTPQHAINLVGQANKRAELDWGYWLNTSGRGTIGTGRFYSTSYPKRIVWERMMEDPSASCKSSCIAPRLDTIEVRMWASPFYLEPEARREWFLKCLEATAIMRKAANRGVDNAPDLVDFASGLKIHDLGRCHLLEHRDLIGRNRITVAPSRTPEEETCTIQF